jgi:peptide-methionine (S)-S-oxide reductase
MWRSAIWLVPVLLLLAFLVMPSVPGEADVPENFPVPEPDEGPRDAGPQLATFGSGCFWCTEAVFQQLKGVTKIVSGYSGGSEANPTYKEVASGATGHAEVVQLTFDPAVISYPELLEVFWRSHDPTTRDRQGNDAGPQYRSVIFTHTDRQRRLAERYKRVIDEAGVFRRPLVTEVEPFTAFYPAESYHQNYYATHRQRPYCRYVIGPKLEKLKRVFAGKLKPDPE